MKVEGRRVYAANREILWSLLHDPIVMQHCWPGCESLEAVGPDEYRAVVELRIGQVVERFTGGLHLEHVIPYEGYSFLADGQNADGSVMVRGRIQLDSAADGTVLSYEADVVVAGRPAAVSPRMLMTTARAFARRGLDTLEKEVAIRTRVYTTTAGEPDAALSPAEALRHFQLRRWLALAVALLGALLIWRGIERQQSRRLARQVADILEQAPLAEAGLAAPEAA